MRLPWDEFISRWSWRQGEHVTLIGPTGCGKTTFARALLPVRRWVLVLATKPRDPVLDRWAREEGYRTVRTAAEIERARRGGDRVILWPRGRSPDETEARQYTEFDRALRLAYEVGGWAVYLDELTYVSGYLGLDRELRRLWYQGRSLGVSVVAAAQAPVHVPRASLDQVSHLVLWRSPDRQRVRRLIEVAGVADPGQVERGLRALRGHEALIVDGRTGALAIVVAPR
jgi:hypothetical protein